MRQTSRFRSENLIVARASGPCLNLRVNETAITDQQASRARGPCHDECKKNIPIDVYRCAIIFSLALLCLLPLSAHAQSFARLGQDPWNGTDFVSTYDHPLIENAGHVKDSGYSESAEMWDSYGRIRTSRTDVNAPFVAYRVFTSNVDTASPLIHPTMDDFELALGLHIGEYQGWKVDTLLGAGYSGTHPFLNEKGIFGIGDITATHAITDNTSILLAVDYAGNGGLLPDVPLPGFAFIHHEDKFDYMLGFPLNRIIWRPIPAVTVTAQYGVPYTGNLDIEYIPFKHFGFYSLAGNFFQGIVNAREDVTNRQFFQMRSIEAGVRLVFDPLIDASIGVGYAFDQSYSNGYDVRSLRPVAQISNEPYIALVLHGRF